MAALKRSGKSAKGLTSKLNTIFIYKQSFLKKNPELFLAEDFKPNDLTS